MDNRNPRGHECVFGLFRRNRKIMALPPQNDRSDVLLEELVSASDSKDDVISARTLADTVFKGYRDDLDFNDESDVGGVTNALRDFWVRTEYLMEEVVDGWRSAGLIMKGRRSRYHCGRNKFVLCILGVHQDIQEKVYGELYEIFGDSDRPATFADTLRMKYLERVIFESLRMYPPVPLIARKLKKMSN
ncbi:Cytochrome P450 4g15 [Eumeta japonica]|uniref:Cytochrome P450 4g15 n=1 Tax=Eumeta variegata TaxID=151549 RepID=A0A4C1XRG8_EUMVA|nr:Cytochrome P450 4g15 [Eumeta japonica]